MNFPEILYEDNHIIAVNKRVGDLVQKDKTGDVALDDIIRNYIKEKYKKPGNVFLGVPHRIDRPTSGVVLFARTGKALPRLNEMFKNKTVSKTYWAVVKSKPPDPEGFLTHYILRKPEQNKSYCYEKEVKNSKIAELRYKIVAQTDNYFLMNIELITGRHHQIRSQLAKIGCPVKGDLKYGFDRSNKDGGIHLHARRIEFLHPVSKEHIVITAPVPEDNLWLALEKLATG